MRKQNSDFAAKFISEEGSRLKNRDYFGYVELDEFACYVIADGITDKADVEGARLAIETVILNFQSSPSMSKRFIKMLLKHANKALLGKESDRRLKASITVVVTDYQKMRYGYAGNTRLRMYRGGEVYKQTKDMSFAQEMVEQQKIVKDELMQHEERNNLYTYLGQKSFSPVISKKIKLVETDMIALYTRGIWENVDEAELDEVFADADNEVQNTVDNIEDLLLSRQPEDLDNYTLAVIFINKVYRNPQRRKRIKKIIIICITVVLLTAVVCAAVWYLHHKKVRRIEDMNYHFTNTVEYVNTGNYIRAKEECKQAQELSEKLKDNSMRNRLQEYMFVIETVILADEAYSSKDYEGAGEYYLSAIDRARYADNIGAEYMENKLDHISDLLSVEDYIALGDKLLEQGDYDAAEEKYLLAKKTAASMHDAEGKQNALDALEKLYEEKADAQSQAQEEADSQAQEAVAAAEIVAAGDKSCLEKDYVGAKVYYTLAVTKYEEMSDATGEQAVQEKLNGDLNTESIEHNIVEINPFYRFNDIFSRILDINLKEYEKTKELFLDAVFHYIAVTDLRMGMSKKDYYFRFLLKELESGQLGQRAKTAIQLFSQNEKKYIVLALMDFVHSHSHLEAFKRLFGEIYQNSMIYVSQDCANEYFIYVGSPETQIEKERVQFLLDTFLPIGMQTEVFYTDHFGILDVEETMALDRILLI